MVSRSTLELVVVFLTMLLISMHESQAASLAKPGCQETCGNVTIPYPFGIGTGCYFDKSFEVLCMGSSQDHYPLRFANNHGFQILEISTNLVHVIDDESAYVCNVPIAALFLDQYFLFTQDLNLFVAVGCNISAKFFEGDLGTRDYGSCESICNEKMPLPVSPTNCTGFNGCCQLSVPENVTSYGCVLYNTTTTSCAIAFIAENNAPISLVEPPSKRRVVLNWVVATTTCLEASKTGDNLCGENSYCVDSTNGLGYNCGCKEGYKGNPYLPNGCQVIVEAIIGASAFSVVGYCTYTKLSTYLSDSGEDLVPRFKYLVKRNWFVEILDNQVLQEAMIDDVSLVTKLAKRCMKTNSQKRPCMKEVVADLDKLK
ncbi:hypothetical protein QVD17_21821 [Tagetes erecta]|uniref:Wall-associated receptor kinase galacturonan-binding domain-containing protein n=1 Tax=Tagetes erecta TaxID=13708 RepID=A0AAD8NT65_TARER|nr:hypothetical protein QVD17_21821 [Tagetes erecta]